MNPGRPVPLPSPRRRRPRRVRRGLTLLELLVAIALMLLMFAVLVPALSNIMMFEQRAAARELSMLYEQLHDEAILRNKSFRIEFDLLDHSYQVQEGSPEVLVFTDADARERFEEREEERLEEMGPLERKEYLEKQGFSSVEGRGLGGKVTLPENTRFRSVYTPQYEDPVEPPTEDELEDRNVVTKAYSYVFSSGFAEAAVIQLVDVDDEDEGFTIVVDPLSGRIGFHTELIDHHDAFEDMPDEGPNLSQ